MKRILIPVVVLVASGVIFWLMILNLQSEPVAGDDLAAIILRAPDGYAVQNLGAASVAAATGILSDVGLGQHGVRFDDEGDTVILLADRVNDRIVEMRASRTGTIVERQWQGGVDRRLSWACENGDLNTPGLPGPTGKNLYH